MQTMAPPEDAATERFARLDERFDRTDEKVVEVDRRVTEVDRRITEFKEDTAHRFKEVNRRIDANTDELRSVRREMRSFHSTFQRGNYTLVATMVGAIIALVIKGG